MAYDFTSLSPSDFEDLSRDLLQAELGVRLESFTSGRDGGVDLRYSRLRDKNWIIQCKHFYKSGWRLLFSNLKLEAEKVRRLAPERYLLTTSLGLTPDNKEDIFTLFSPYIQSTADIIGANDLNNFLGKHPRVERAHFKLWLASSAILDRILNSATFTRTEQIVADLQRQVRLYVSNDSFPRALDILTDKHVCIIAGIPGIGKTFLARMLMLHHLQQEYEAVVVSADIEEANKVYSPSRHQFFYYDDFLGTSFDESLPKNEDARLVEFIQRVSRSPNKRLILTTREYILRRATSRYERLAHALDHDLKCVIQLEDYTRLVRGQILYNHLYFSELPHATVAGFCNDRSYKEVLRHENFSPRLLEFAINQAATRKLHRQEFTNFLSEVLNHPERLWDHAFRHQLSPLAQSLLFALLFLPKSSAIQDLSSATATLAMERNKSNLSGIDFSECLKNLEGTFLTIEAPAPLSRLARFLTPAIADYLLRLIDQDSLEITHLVTSAVFFEQLKAIWSASQSRNDAGDMGIQFRLPGLRGWLRNNVSVFVASVQRTFLAESCLWRDSNRWPDNEPVRLTPSSEARFLEVLELANSLESEDLRKWVAVEAATLSLRWSQRVGSRAAAASLLEVVDVPEEARVALKDWALEDIKAADDFDAALRMLETASDIADEKFRETLLDKFFLFVQSESDYILEDEVDPSSAESAMDNIEQIAAALEVSPGWDEGSLRGHIEHLRSREDDFDPDLALEAHDTRSESGIRSGFFDELKIDTLFDSLARSLEGAEEAG
jgi:Restriction endonuclease